LGHLIRAGALALLIFLSASPALAAEEEAGWSYRMAGELMSPFCPGRALSDCPSPNAAELRQWIVAQEEAGVAPDVVEEQLYEAWGDELRQAPRAEGIGLLAYGIPLVAGLLGAGIVVVFLRRQVSRDPAPLQQEPPTALPPEPAGELERLVDAELARRS
jgi:cytochrome c-type biogenesis protein CcmH/NrfF